MSAFQRFVDIEAWQKARDLAKVIFALTNDGQFARDFGLRDQIRERWSPSCPTSQKANMYCKLRIAI